MDAGLTLELCAILEMKMIPMLLFLHLKPISISFQMSLIDLTLLSKWFITTCMAAASKVLFSRKRMVWRFDCLAFGPGNDFKETSPFFMKELNSPIRKFFRMTSLKRTILLRFLITVLLKVDCVLSKCALGWWQYLFLWISRLPSFCLIVWIWHLLFSSFP